MVRRFGLVAVVLCSGSLLGANHRLAPLAPEDAAWTADFVVEPDELGPTGRNPYFVLEPGYRLTLKDDDEQLVITVLDATRQVDGVTTRVVEERETKAGALIEVSRNYFAISRRSNSLYYFGEEVDIYKNGQIVAHEGAWLSGADGAKFGLMMPGDALLGAKHYQEVAPQVAMDRAETVSLRDTVATPAGEFQNCVKIEETTPLEPGVKEYKSYARGVGLVRDGSLKLVSYGKTEAAR